MKSNEKIKTSNLILIFLAVWLVLFTVAMIIIFCKYQAVPDTLITSVFGFCGAGEAGFIMVIKVAKIISGKEKEDDDE